MLNAEKHKKEILEITEEGYNFAVSKDRQNIVRCTVDFTCENCIFGEESDCCYSLARMKWLLSEYKEPIKLTRLEYEILKWLDKEGYKYIVRDSSDNLEAHDSTPKKVFSNYNGWVSKNEFKTLSPFAELFQFVQWEDEEPALIKQVLKNCEVADDDERREL